MSDITEQFEFTQVAWVGNAAFPRKGTGMDPVLSLHPNLTAPLTIRWQDGAGGRTGNRADFDFWASVILQDGA